MRIPQLFLPEKNLDDKIVKLSKDNIKTKNPFEESYLYDIVCSNLKRHLISLKEGPVKIFWISDKHQESKYEELGDIIHNVIAEFSVKLDYDIHDYYGKKFGRIDMVKILDNSGILNRAQIVYVNHETTEALREGMENLPFFDHSFVITV